MNVSCDPDIAFNAVEIHLMTVAEGMRDIMLRANEANDNAAYDVIHKAYMATLEALVSPSFLDFTRRFGECEGGTYHNELASLISDNGENVKWNITQFVQNEIYTATYSITSTYGYHS